MLFQSALIVDGRLVKFKRWEGDKVGVVARQEKQKVFASPPQIAFPHISLKNLVFFLSPHFFFIRTLQTRFRLILRSLFTCHFSVSNKFPLPTASPPPPPASLNQYMQFYRPRCFSLNKAMASTELFLKYFFFQILPHFSAFEPPTQKLHAITKHPHPPSKTSQRDT